MSENSKFYIKPAPGEQIKTRIIMNSSAKSSIYASVVDNEDKPIKGALVLLFRVGEDEVKPDLISNCYTDDEGQFVFGNLEGNILYKIKVFKENTKIRELEIKA